MKQVSNEQVETFLKELRVGYVNPCSAFFRGCKSFLQDEKVYMTHWVLIGSLLPKLDEYNVAYCYGKDSTGLWIRKQLRKSSFVRKLMK